jgi:hypothetical protein
LGPADHVLNDFDMNINENHEKTENHFGGLPTRPVMRHNPRIHDELTAVSAS